MKTGRITKDMKSRLKLAENMIFKLNGSHPCPKRTDCLSILKFCFCSWISIFFSLLGSAWASFSLPSMFFVILPAFSMSAACWLITISLSTLVSLVLVLKNH